MVMEITQAERKAAQLDLRRLPVLAKQQINHAELPAKYKAARKALQECWRIDELKDIQDKHSAIAHYAKQAKDETLLYYAERIKLRAFERIGELLKEIPSASERSKVAKENGIAATTACRAYDAVHTPKKVRDQLIETSPPPTMTKLAEYGRRYIPKTHDSKGGRFHNYVRREHEVKRTPNVLAHDFADTVRSIEYDIRSYYLKDGCGGELTMAQLGRSVHPEDAPYIRESLMPLIEALDEFEQALPKGGE